MTRELKVKQYSNSLQESHATPTAGSRRRMDQSRQRTYTPTAAVGVWPSAYCFVGVQGQPSAYSLAIGVRTWDPQDGVDGRFR